jgi:antitoxin component YwqK of YwqJK toxin-antitoxin module
VVPLWCKYAVYGDENQTDGSFIRRFPSVLSFPSSPSYTSRMNRILASIVLLTLLFPSIAIGETMDDLVYRDGLYYKKFTEVPFTGKTTGKIQGTFRNGKMDGPYVRWYENGQLSSKGTHKDDEMVGPWVRYHDNGQLKEKGTYRDGKRDGPWVNYHDNGRLWIKETYKDGKNDGPAVWYYENGQLWSKGTWKDGKQDGTWVGYNRDGTVNPYSKGNYKDSKKVK